MTQLKLKAKEFKKMADPNYPKGKHVKYVCYVQANSIPQEMSDWMETNPREQKMTTNVANKIKDSLRDNEYFHELNRGILISSLSTTWDNKTEELTISFDNPEIHGNIDGGHTLRAILEAKSKNYLSNDKFVFFEIFEGIESPVELAAARNTSVQVDLKSIAELENSFEILKEALSNNSFYNRIQFKMNEHYNDEGIDPIDVREIISILLMFSQEIYPYKTADGVLSDVQPMQCYSGKEASLKKFLKQNGGMEEQQKIDRENMIRNMMPIIDDIFTLWEKIETSFASVSNGTGRRFGTRKYTKYDGGKVVGKSFLQQQDLQYYIPKGLMYPVVGSFRALVQRNTDGTYYWKKNPIEVWDALGAKLVTIVLDEKAENPDVIAKNSNLWSNLFKEVYIYGYMS
jgi:hypothetical protein